MMVYESGQNLLARNGNCGFKFNIANSADVGDYSFKLLRNSGEYLAAGAAVTLAALALM
jgi:hypothetical protein